MTSDPCPGNNLNVSTWSWKWVQVSEGSRLLYGAWNKTLTDRAVVLICRCKDGGERGYSHEYLTGSQEKLDRYATRAQGRAIYDAYIWALKGGEDG